MTKANAAQVLAGFIWKNKLPNNILEGSLTEGFSTNSDVLLEYLMKFQQWVYDHQAANTTTVPDQTPGEVQGT